MYLCATTVDSDGRVAIQTREPKLQPGGGLGKQFLEGAGGEKIQTNIDDYSLPLKRKTKSRTRVVTFGKNVRNHREYEIALR